MVRRPRPRQIFVIPLVTLWLCLPACTARAVQMAGAQHGLDDALRRPDDWYQSPDGRAFCDRLITWQQPNGGWWKAYDLTADRPADLPPPKVDAAPGDPEE